MPLSDNQKLRLQQLEIPCWIHRKVTETTTQQDTAIERGESINQTILYTKGEQPTIFWLLENAYNLPSEKFMNDVSIAIRTTLTSWQAICGDIRQLQKKIISENNSPVCIVLKASATTVEFEATTDTILMPIQTATTPSLKRQLWMLIQANFYE